VRLRPAGASTAAKLRTRLPLAIAAPFPAHPGWCFTRAREYQIFRSLASAPRRFDTPRRESESGRGRSRNPNRDHRDPQACQPDDSTLI
jgi:hypothetical protein